MKCVNDLPLVRSPRALWFVAAALVALSVGCSDDEGSGNNGAGVGDTGVPDSSGDIDFAKPDNGAFDIGPQPDFVPDPGTFLAPCDNNDECDSGQCIDSPKGKLCTKVCEESCPTGFDCKQKKGTTGDFVYLCVPRYLYLCHPCSSNVHCNDPGDSGNACVAFGDGGMAGNFCGVKCNIAKPDCPSGFSCQAAPGGHQCLPVDLVCTCNQKAIDLALETACITAKAIDGITTAMCYGVRKCTASGLSECSAALPEVEKCDGVDNDCNGKTDDFDGSTKVKCAGESNEFGSCPGVVIACLDGKPKCNAPMAQPEQCNGLDDNCDGVTDEGLCDDGIPCTEDKCKGDTCHHQQVNGLPCDDGIVCTQTDKCLQGKCIGGNEIECDDKDPCTTDNCDPFSGCKHKAASDAICPDDGIACTQDICKEGKCLHPPVNDGGPCVDDGNLCTADVCTNGQCVHTAVDGVKCNDEGNPCTNDVCQNKQCEHVPANGKGCVDDGKPCTTDVCEAGNCIHPPKSGKCEDGNPCTKGDNCQSGTCLAGKWDQCDDGNPCTKGACNKITGCVQNNNDFVPCKASSGECPLGQCQGGGCYSKPNELCKTKIKVDLCGKVDAQGLCTGGGKCVPKSSPKGVGCTKQCAGICFNCFGFEVCWEF